MLKQLFIKLHISKKEQALIVWVSLLLIIITTLPYIYGYITRPENTYFLGVSLINRVDYPVYFSYIEQAKAGNFLFKDLFTSEDQPQIIFHLFFLVLGFVAKLFSLSPIYIFQLARIILIPVFVFIIYLFISFVFSKKQERTISLLLICFSSGIGAWFLPWMKQAPMDTWVPEAITFLSLYTHPLFILSLSLIILIFFLMLFALKYNRLSYAFIAGVCGLVLFQIHPYHFPTIFLTLILFWLGLFIYQKRIHWRFFKYGIIFTLISAPSIIYYWRLSSAHWLTAHRIAQAIPLHLTPPLWNLGITYGILWVLALTGMYIYLKKRKINIVFLFLCIWLISHIVLIYSPLPFQRRMIEGLHIVISIFATFSIFLFYKNAKNYLKSILIVLFIFVLAFSNIYNIARDIKMFKTSYLSVPEKLITAMQWLKNNTLKNAIILNTSEVHTGNLIPAFAIRKTYIGHGVETAYAQQKQQEVTWFFNTNNNDKAKYDFLKKNNINYVFFSKGEEDSQLPKESRESEEAVGFQPQEKNYLKLVYENKFVNIYKVL